MNLCGCDVDCMASHKWRALFSTHFSAMKITVSAFQWVALLKLILSCYLFLFLFFAFLSCGLRVRFLFTLLLNNDHSIRYSLFRGALKMRERKFISAVNDNRTGVRSDDCHLAASIVTSVNCAHRLTSSTTSESKRDCNGIHGTTIICTQHCN